MKIKRLNESSEMGKFVQEIEQMMDKKGVKITGNNLCLVIGDVEFNIGRDQDVFPRMVEEPFWYREF